MILQEYPKITVGGLGGSGTRVLAEILKKAGIYIGKDINHENDNLLFTRLFKNPNWYKNATKESIFERLNIFKKCMLGYSLSKTEKAELKFAQKFNPTIKTPWFYKANKSPSKDYQFWGWKEPNTHIYLKELSEYFPKLKYIHVIRNGFDMAFSNNNQQLQNWGQLMFNIAFPEKKTKIPQNQLAYWIIANERAVKIGMQQMKDRFYICSYENLCNNAETEIRNILRFLEIEIDPMSLKNLISIPKIKYTKPKYSFEDLEIFTEEQKLKTKKIGKLSGLLADEHI